MTDIFVGTIIFQVTSQLPDPQQPRHIIPHSPL